MSQDQLKTEARALLSQFGQIILSGPPGTGKTRLALHVAADILGKTDPEVLRDGKEPRFALVQFHPAYNYEDFVRGVQVKTDDNNVVYQTVDRVFGKMAKDAADHSEKHVLVIDEINRANVSAVLGELIYALEYRGAEVQIPYAIDDKTGLVIPKNLLVIGTMNTADRTIGQIDYAVRRRFAFVHCPPDRAVVENVGGNLAVEFFDMADNVFAHLSPDHDKEDVQIGHSYFLADGTELARKIIYQVVPILREYLKDGVLLKKAGEKIQEIENKARVMLETPSAMENESTPEATANLRGSDLEWRWIHPHSGSCGWLPLRRMVLSLVQNYVKHQKPQSFEALERAFPKECASCPAVFLDFGDSRVQENLADYFTNKEEKISLPGGRVVVVCSQWGAFGENIKSYFDKFKKRAEELGYTISHQKKHAN